MIYLDDNVEWVKLDKRGRPYYVERRDGRRIVPTTRPKEFAPEEWRSLSQSHEHRKALAEEYKKREEEAVTEHDDDTTKKSEGRRRRKKKTKEDKAEAEDTREVDELFKSHDIAASKTVTSKHQIVDSVPSECLKHSDHTICHAFDENNNWIEWEEFVSVVNPAAASVPIATHHSIAHSTSIPVMPCIHRIKDDHRERLGDSFMGNMFVNALVSRPVGRKDMLSDPEALESMMKEWKGQWSAGVYDFEQVREYDDVIREASKKGEEIHMARVHGICVEKHLELPKEDKRRKFKGRGVLLGNQVKNQNYSWQTQYRPISKHRCPE